MYFGVRRAKIDPTSIIVEPPLFGFKMSDRWRTAPEAWAQMTLPRLYDVDVSGEDVPFVDMYSDQGECSSSTISFRNA